LFPPFNPSPLLRHPHVQTVLGTLLRSTVRVATRRERLETPDGDFLDLDWVPTASTGPVVLVIHGLAGSSASGCVQSTLRSLQALPVRPVAMNFRGCSGQPNRTDVLYHSGKSDDLGIVVQRLLSEGEEDLLLVGFSMGGNVLLKWLGEQGDRVPPRVRAALAMSVPYQLQPCARYLEKDPLSRFYRWLLVRTLRERILDLLNRFPGRLDRERVLQARTFEDFDEHVTAPLHGFAGARDYYARCSSAPFLQRIRCRTVLIGARDDPFLPAEALPHLEPNPWVGAEFHPHGGHVGFVGPGLNLWAEARIRRFVQDHVRPRSPS